MSLRAPAIACRTMDIEPTSPALAQHTRREIIKKSAAAGVAVWAAPAILSVSRAAAASPVTPPVCCDCTNDATALRVDGTGVLSGIDITVDGEPCVVGPVSAGPGLLSASLLCSETGCAADACFATASVDEVSTGGLGLVPALLSAAEIASSATAPCNCDAPSGTTNIASLTVLGTPIVGPGGVIAAGAIPVDFTPANVVVNVSGVGSATAIITLNEQDCISGQLRVRAVHITISLSLVLVGSGTADIVISESIAKAAACPGCV